MKMKEILSELRKKNLSVLTPNVILDMNKMAQAYLDHKAEDLDELEALIRICNILYNRTDSDVLPIEDGVYDILLEYYKKFNPNFQVGSEVIEFHDLSSDKNIVDKINPIRFFDDDPNKDEYFFFEKLTRQVKPTRDDCKISPIKFTGTIDKRTHDTSHNHPELVGTLDKCKFVLMEDAIEKGVENDSNVKVLERDFFAKHIMDGIIDPKEEIEMVLELKYDGISVEADCTNAVESARTRGDTGIGQASDITPILDGYPFTHAYDLIGEGQIGVKFEAIMTYGDLYRFNTLRNANYSNCRTAIIGLFGASDANRFRDLITLVPLAIDRSNVPGVEWNRMLEIEFLNKYYATKCQPLRYAYIKGDYKQCLFYIKAFLQEAEMARANLDFMYDGIVVSYLDEKIRARLGRKNNINKYSMAVKFNPLKKQTIFTGYEYTVGQDGTITPMIHYNQVEFYGTLHNKSTGNSYGRFKKLNLKVGDIIDVTYVNDVMPRVTRHECQHNIDNPNPEDSFIRFCPVCDTKIVFTEASAFCPNMQCPGRLNARLSNMMDKLNIKDFAENSIEALKVKSLEELLSIDLAYAQSILGVVNGQKLIDRLNELKSKPIPDYTIIGALGFSNIAAKKWQKIFSVITLGELLNLYMDDLTNESNMLENIIIHIKGIGSAIYDTIHTEMGYFIDDIRFIKENMNVIDSKGMKFGKQIRCTGFRDKELFAHLRTLGLDADENASVTKTTDILLVPIEGFTSTKTAKVNPENTLILSREEFVSNMDKYL